MLDSKVWLGFGRPETATSYPRKVGQTLKFEEGVQAHLDEHLPVSI